jgi:putative inorganic carbon (HCO3(-)) transporter
MAAYTDNVWQRFRQSLPPAWVCALTASVGILVPLLLLRLPMVLVVGAGLAAIGLGVIVAQPYVGLLLFLGLLYLRPEDIWPALGEARLTLVISLIAMFAWLINGLLVRERFRLHLPAVQAFLIFLVVAVGSTLIAGSGALAEEAMEILKLLVLFVLMVHLLNSEKRVHGTMMALVLFSAILGARTLWQFQQGEALVQSDGAVRALGTGIFSDPNDLALAMAMAVPMALGIGLGLGRAVPHQQWITRGVSLLCVPIFVGTLYVTDSRGGMLALGAALFLYFRRQLGRIGILLGALAVLALFAAGPARMGNMSAQEESAAGRIDAWRVGIEMLVSSPIWGVGKGQFTEWHDLTAHNSFVLCFAELGTAGTMAWLALFYFIFRDGRLLARKAHSRLQAPRSTSRRTADVMRDGEPAPVNVERGARSLERALRPWSRSGLVQISLLTFAVGGFFLSRTYTPPLYVYLALGLAATQAEAAAAGIDLPGASARDGWRVGAGFLIGLALINGLVRWLG